MYLRGHERLKKHEAKIVRVCQKYAQIEDVLEVISMWDQPERYYHNLDHMSDLFDLFDTRPDGSITCLQPEPE